MSSGSDVENELAAMKAQLSGGSAPKELSGEAQQSGQQSTQQSAQPAQQPATQPVAEPARPQDGDVR
jgi:phage shock protein A